MDTSSGFIRGRMFSLFCNFQLYLVFPRALEGLKRRLGVEAVEYSVPFDPSTLVMNFFGEPGFEHVDLVIYRGYFFKL